MVFQLHLDTETVDHIDVPPALCVEPDVSVRQVLQQLKQENRGCALICEDGKLEGIFTERDALHVMAKGADLDAPIRDVMTSSPAIIHASDTVESAIAKMSGGGYRRLPVVDEAHQPLGLLKVSGILHFLVEHFPKFVYNLPPDPDQTSQQREGA